VLVIWRFRRTKEYSIFQIDIMILDELRTVVI
jgi:hypothetical protein